MSVHGRVVASEPCNSCGSTDNVKRYEDGYAKCFGADCGWWEAGESADGVREGLAGGDDRDCAGVPTGGDLLPLIEVTYSALPKRGLSEETCRRFKYGVGVKANGTPVQVAHYGNGIQKYRTADKKFGWINRPKDGPKLFGQHLWRPGRKLIVTEGEIDALSYAEATGCQWAVVSVPDGAGDAPRAIARNLEWVSAFEEVIFLFDMDEPGQAAAVKCCEILPPGKAFIGKLARKDANEVLLELGAGELMKAPWKAEPWRPDGIVEGVSLIEKILVDPAEGVPYPWHFLTVITRGQRTGEMVTWIAGTGAGKSAVMREVAMNLRGQTGQRVGFIALEESNTRSALGLLSVAAQKPLHLGHCGMPKAELETLAKQVLPGFAFYDHFGSVEADVLIPKIRYMAHALGIRWFILDHLSIMVSGMAAEGDERKRLDQLTTQLRSLCSELDVGLHIVSHLRKASGKPHEEGGQVSLQDIRGSGAPAQLSDFVIALERDQQAEDNDERNTTKLRVLKNRLTGETGLVGSLRFNHETSRLIPAEEHDDGEAGEF